jgi:hydroxyacylglutathione hydrolase
MKKIPLEDTFVDVVGKAQRGLGVTDAALAQQAGIDAAKFAAFKSGAFDAAIARTVARALHLGADALIELGERSWYPEPREVAGLASFNTEYEDMTVNSYLAFDPKTKQAVVFDYAKEQQLKIELILLTHTHPDHVADLERLKKATSAPVYVGEKENFGGGEPFAAGKIFQVGNLKIESRQTSGHARGGITYVVSGLESRLAVVGDALFAASMGGGAISYEEALRTNRQSIFSLPDDTVICPGHGPLTTVGEQKKHNPFYPEFQK